MRLRVRIIQGALVALFTGLLASCGSDTIAGKTTTTSNGGDLVAIGPDGHPQSGCIVWAARSWNSATGKPGIVDTLFGDSAGVVRLEDSAYAFLEIHDRTGNLGARLVGFQLLDRNRHMVSLDTLHQFRGRWADRAGIRTGRLFLDSSFHSAPLLDTTGSFAFDHVPMGEYTLALDADARPVRPMGAVHLGSDDLRYMGSANVILSGDTTGSPLWIDDFESGEKGSMLKQSLPGVSPWFLWWLDATMALPTSNTPDSILRAIGPDSSRKGRSFHSRFATTAPDAEVAVGITNMEVDLRARNQVCFAYRADSPLKIEFQRDSVAGVRPVLSTTLPSASLWRDTCAAISSFAPDSNTPDSLKPWSSFGSRILVIQFSVSAGATFLDLDDVRIR